MAQDIPQECMYIDANKACNTQQTNKNKTKMAQNSYKQQRNKQKQNNQTIIIVLGVKNRLLQEHEINIINSINKVELLANQYQMQKSCWSNSRPPKELHLNADGRYQCPRGYCGKTYKDASSLQRHIRCVCFLIQWILFQLPFKTISLKWVALLYTSRAQFL